MHAGLLNDGIAASAVVHEVLHLFNVSLVQRIMNHFFELSI